MAMDRGKTGRALGACALALQLAWAGAGLGCSSTDSGEKGSGPSCAAGTVAAGDLCVPAAPAGPPTAGLGGAAGGVGVAGSTGTGTGGVGAGGMGGSADPGAAGTTPPVAQAGSDAPGMQGGSSAGPPPAGSTGCGAMDYPAEGMQTLDVDGTTREFIVALPDGYDPNTPYKLIFAWHGLGGTAMQVAGGGFAGFGYYGLESRAAGTAIFVAGQGLDTSNSVGSGPGWDNMGGRDVAFTVAMLAHMRASYCIDDARIFSVGMSYGGIMSNTVGCALGEDFRAIAPMSGLGPSAFGGPACVGQVAAWLSHGNMDNVVAFSSGQGSRDHWVAANHCDTTPGAPDANGCVAYPGCDDGYPVTWCEFDGGHTVPSFAGDAIWQFFSQF